jgi:thioredoxin 1
VLFLLSFIYNALSFFMDFFSIFHGDLESSAGHFRTMKSGAAGGENRENLQSRSFSAEIALHSAKHGFYPIKRKDPSLIAMTFRCCEAFADRRLFPIVNFGEPLVNELIVHVSDDSFENDVLQSSTPVLVDYWAEWCGPCKMIAPVLDEIAAEYDGKIKVVKLNIDDNPNTPPKYGIRGIPTLMLFKGGEVEATKVGAVSKSQLTAFIDSNL